MIIECTTIDEVARTLRMQSPDTPKERYFIAGPCGIGKTTLGRILSSRLHVHFIDHDEMKSKLKVDTYPCSVFKLNIVECLSQSLLFEGNPQAYIFAVGGDSVFRPGIDNDERLRNLQQAKEKFGFVVMVLTATEEILEERFIQVGSRKKENFLSVWNNWVKIERPYWEKCANCFIETSRLNLSDR